MITPFSSEPPKIGSAPVDANDYNTKLGYLLRTFLSIRGQINQWQAWQASINLEVQYGFTADDAALSQSAINQLDADLDSIDLTFINRLAGP